MKYLKKIELKDINNNKKEIKKSYQKGKEYYKNTDKEKNG